MLCRAPRPGLGAKGAITRFPENIHHGLEREPPVIQTRERGKRAKKHTQSVVVLSVRPHKETIG